MFRNTLTAAVVALALLCVPSQLAAEEAAARAEIGTSMLEWFSGVWNEVTAWFAADEVPPPPSKPLDTLTTDGSCAVDPNGRCLPGS